MVQEDAILPFIEGHLGVPATRLRDGMIDPVAVRLLPRRMAERSTRSRCSRSATRSASRWPIRRIWNNSTKSSGSRSLRVRPVFAFRSSIQRTLPRCYEEGFEVDTVTADIDESAVQLQADAAEVDLTNVESMVDGSPIINLVNYLLVQAIRAGASDIHIEPSRKFSVVRFRVDGQMYEALRPRRDMHPALVSRIKVMGKMDIAEHHKPQDGRFQVTVEGREVDFRVSTLPTVLGEKIVLRILDKENLTFNLDLLGVPPDMLKQLKQLLAKPYGLMLVTGPTGSGKTTTLYSALELIKNVHSNVVSVEDPVEYQVELVNQVQVDESRQLSFSSALRSILRQDPDIIMIGEIRDVPTAQIAVQAALTGHLVLSTLHTNDCAGAIHRLIDMGIEPFKIAAALVGVVAQRLIRTVCQSCKTFVVRVGRTAGNDSLQRRPAAELRPRRRLPEMPRHRFCRSYRHLRSDGRRPRDPRTDRRRRRHRRDPRLLPPRRRQDAAGTGHSPGGKGTDEPRGSDASGVFRISNELEQ